MASEKTEEGAGAAVLILGGLGMVGRNLVAYLVENRLASTIRVADKQIEDLAYLSPRHEYCFANEVVECMQMDLSKDRSVTRAFKREGGWDYVFCLAAEVTYGKADDVYAQRTVGLAVKCASAAAECGSGTRFVYMSSAQVYASQTKKAATEESKMKPWTTPAKFHLEAEEALRKISALNLVIVRPALIYGSGDHMAIMPFAVVAYAATEDKMALLWDKHLCRNTVHVSDVCRALWLVAKEAPSGALYNLADPNHTTQGHIAKIFSEMFGVKIGYHGKIVSNLARVRMDTVVETANDNHVRPWMWMLDQASIPASPLTPFMHREMLNHNHLFVDGSKITRELRFAYKHPAPTLENLSEVVYEYVKMDLLPASDLVLPAMKARKLEEAAAEGATTGGAVESGGGEAAAASSSAATGTGAGAGAGAGAGSA